MHKIQMLIFVAFSIILSGGLADAGECCKAYTNPYGEYQSEKFCNNYCCFQFPDYVCCDSETMHDDAVARGQVDDFCAAWFQSHVWAPVLIGIAGLAVFITLATCCCCCCCGACGTCFGCCDKRSVRPVIVTSPAQSQFMFVQNETRTSINNGYI